MNSCLEDTAANAPKFPEPVIVVSLSCDKNVILRRYLSRQDPDRPGEDEACFNLRLQKFIDESGDITQYYNARNLLRIVSHNVRHLSVYCSTHVGTGGSLGKHSGGCRQDNWTDRREAQLIFGTWGRASLRGSREQRLARPVFEYSSTVSETLSEPHISINRYRRCSLNLREIGGN